MSPILDARHELPAPSHPAARPPETTRRRPSTMLDLELGWLLARRGELNAATAMLDMALDQLDPADAPDLIALAHYRRGEVRSVQGALSAALDDFEDAATLAAEIRDADLRVSVLEAQARCLARLDRHEEAYQVQVRVTALRTEQLHQARSAATLGRDMDPVQASPELLAHAREAAARALQHEMHDAQAAVQERTRQLSTMSHEIRTPLNGVLGMTDVLLQTPLSEEQRDLLEVIKVSGRTTLSIVDEVLTWSRLDAGAVEPDPVRFDLIRSVHQTLRMLDTAADTRGLDLVLEAQAGTPTQVIADEARIRQLVINLVNNAIRFTDEGEVRVRLSVPADDRIRLEVVDTGVGIDPTDAARLFEPFVQAARDTHRHRGGTGLGLNICKRIVTALDGTLGAEGMPGEGSTFWFELPVVAPEGRLDQRMALDASSALGHEATAAPTALSGHVLVVEDNVVNQRVVRLMLERLGVSCDLVGDGPDALEAAARGSYDLVLLDLHLPTMDGDAVAAQLDRSAAPVVLLTADVLGDGARDLPVDDVLSKPLTLDRLEACLTSWLQG